MGKKRRALVRGVPANHWFIQDDRLVLHHPFIPGVEAVVPISALLDDAQLDNILRPCDWISRRERDELDEIAHGART